MYDPDNDENDLTLKDLGMTKTDLLKEPVDYVITGEWDGEQIIRPMTTAERYFRDLHRKTT